MNVAAREMVTENSAWMAPLREEVGRVIVGQKHLLDRLLIAMLTNGHVLLEGVPGLAKTLTLKALASCISVRFNRQRPVGGGPGPAQNPAPEDPAPSPPRPFQAAAVHARHAARRYRRHHDL